MYELVTALAHRKEQKTGSVILPKGGWKRNVDWCTVSRLIKQWMANSWCDRETCSYGWAIDINKKWFTKDDQSVTKQLRPSTTTPVAAASFSLNSLEFVGAVI